PPPSILFPYTTLFRSPVSGDRALQPGRLRPSDAVGDGHYDVLGPVPAGRGGDRGRLGRDVRQRRGAPLYTDGRRAGDAGRLCARSEEHTSELQSRSDL